MPVDQRYRKQVAQLVRVLPLVAEQKCFALKGGTAINLFIRNLPRLSVDIDLAYLPVGDRKESLLGIENGLSRIQTRIEESFPSAQVQRSHLKDDGTVNKLFVHERGALTKIEVTPVLRGCVREPMKRSVSNVVESQFGFATNLVVSFADLYANKFVAALDRQHPRDLFDVRDLLLNEGIDTPLRTAFVVYLISHSRPLAALLNPVRRDMMNEYTHGLAGMMVNEVTLEQLVQTREELITSIVGDMPKPHRQFLLSFQRGMPEWQLLDVAHARTLPAVRWRMLKLARLSEENQRKQTAALEAVIA